MCAICCDNNLRLITNVDPTHTLSTRRRFVADIDKRFNALKKEVRKQIETGALLKKDNPFGGFTINVTSAEWRSRYDPDRIPEFLEWLEEQNNKFILSKSGSGIQVFPSQTTPLFPGQASFDAKTQTTTRVLGGVEGRWTDVHIRSAYQKGVQQARINLRKQGIDIPSFESTAEGLSGVFNAPFHADRVQLAFTQTYSGLQGVTKAMEAPIARVLAMGMAEGRNPKALAREIAGIKGTINKVGMQRARTLARTEVIRAHHGANIAEFRAIGIEDVIIKAEWLTAGDNRVCPRCESLEGQIFKLDEIEPMIPLHPNCRCVAIPIVPRGKRGQVVKKAPIVEEEVWKSIKNPKEFSESVSKNFNIFGVDYGGDTPTKVFPKMKEALNHLGRDLTRMKTQNKGLAKIMNASSVSMDLFNTNLINKNALGAYNPIRKEIKLAMKGKFKKDILRLGDWTTGGKDISSLFRHEFGHHIHNIGLGEIGRTRQWRELFQSKPTQWWKKNVSQYGASNSKEAFAESFSAYTSPLHNIEKPNKTLPDEILKLFNGWFR